MTQAELDLLKNRVSGYDATLDASAPAYAPSQAYLDAQAALTAQMQNKPGAYQSQYGGQINDLVNQAVNRKPFQYDMNVDPLYQQYKKQYTDLGNRAMRDTMGQAAQLTGGYGNSYAATAGNQANQYYLNQLNNMVPELYQQAANNYYQQGQQLFNSANALQGLEQTAYGQYRDTVGDYNTGLNLAMNQEQSAYGRDMDLYNAALQQYNAGQNMAFQRQQADQAQYNYDAANMKKKSGGGGKKSSPQPAANTAAQDAMQAASDIQNAYAGSANADAYALNYIKNQALQGKITMEESYAIADALGIQPGTKQTYNTPSYPDDEEEVHYDPDW